MEHQGDLAQSFAVPPINVPASNSDEYSAINPYRRNSRPSSSSGKSVNSPQRTFFTDVETSSGISPRYANTSLPSINGSQVAESPETVSLEQQILETEQHMLQCEKSANYREAERCKRQLETLRSSLHNMLRDRLYSLQSEDVRLFVSMIEKHQTQFEQLWAEKQHEHRLRANELIDAIKVI